MPDITISGSIAGISLPSDLTVTVGGVSYTPAVTSVGWSVSVPQATLDAFTGPIDITVRAQNQAGVTQLSRIITAVDDILTLNVVWTDEELFRVYGNKESTRTVTATVDGTGYGTTDNGGTYELILTQPQDDALSGTVLVSVTDTETTLNKTVYEPTPIHNLVGYNIVGKYLAYQKPVIDHTPDQTFTTPAALEAQLDSQFDHNGAIYYLTGSHTLSSEIKPNVKNCIITTDPNSPATLDGGSDHDGGSGSNFGFLLDNCTNTEVSNFNITGMQYHGIAVGRENNENGGLNNRILCNTITECGTTGIAVRNQALGTLIEANTISLIGSGDTRGEGVYIGYGVASDSTNHVFDTTVRGNEIFDTNAEGIDVKRNSRGVVIEFNHIHDVDVKSQGAITCLIDKGDSYTANYNADVIIRSNVIQDTTTRDFNGNGIVIGLGTALIEDNIIFGNAASGISVYSDFEGPNDDCTIRNNIVWENGGDDIEENQTNGNGSSTANADITRTTNYVETGAGVTETAIPQFAGPFPATTVNAFAPGADPVPGAVSFVSPVEETYWTSRTQNWEVTAPTGYWLQVHVSASPHTSEDNYDIANFGGLGSDVKTWTFTDNSPSGPRYARMFYWLDTDPDLETDPHVAGNYVDIAYTTAFAAGAPIFTGTIPSLVPNKGQSYSYDVRGFFSGDSALTYTLESGTLPTGLSLTNGVITGTSDDTTVYSGLVIRATDTAALSVDSNAFSIHVMPVVVPGDNSVFVALTGSNGNDGSSEGNALRTIAYARSLATAGDTIYIKAGDYGDDPLVMSGSGSSTAAITFEGYKTTPGDNPRYPSQFNHNTSIDASVMPVIDRGDRTDPGGNACIYASGSYLIFKNILCTGDSIGFSGSSISEFYLENIISVDTGDGGEDYYGKGIKFSTATNGTVKDTVAVNACAELFTLASGNNVVVDGHHSYCNENSGNSSTDYYFAMSNSYDNTVRNCHVERVGNLDHPGHGFEPKSFNERNIFEDNTATNIEGGAFSVRHTGAKNNTFRRNISYGGAGIFIRDGAANNTFEDHENVSCIHDIVGYTAQTEDPYNSSSLAMGSGNVIRRLKARNASSTFLSLAPYSNSNALSRDLRIEDVDLDGAPYLCRGSHRSSNLVISGGTIKNVPNYATAESPRTVGELDLTLTGVSLSNTW